MSTAPKSHLVSTGSSFNKTYYTRIARIFDTVAPAYDCQELRFFRKGAHVLSQLMPLKGDEHLLDVGTGTGEVALAISKRVKQGKVTGIDVAEEMLKRAREKAISRGVSNITFEKRDILDGHPRQGIFQGAVSGFAVSLFPDIELCVKAIAKCVCEGGFVAISTFTQQTFEPHISQAFSDAEQVGAAIPGAKERKRFSTQVEHCQIFQAAGLRQVKSDTMQFGYVLENLDAWWRFLSNSGFRGILMDMTPDQLKNYQELHYRQMDRVFGDSGFNINIPVRFTLGWKN